MPNHPVKLTHEIINLAGKLDWHTQRQDIPTMEETIIQLRNKLNQLQKFMKSHEVES